MTLETWEILGIATAILGVIGGMLWKMHTSTKSDAMSLTKALDRHEKHISNLSTTIEQNYKHTDLRFDGIEKRLDRGTEKMDSIDNEVVKNGKEIAELKGSIKAAMPHVRAHEQGD